MKGSNIHLIGLSEGQAREQEDTVFKAGRLDTSWRKCTIPKAKIKKPEKLSPKILRNNDYVLSQ